MDHIGARFMNFLSFELQITLYVSKSAVAAFETAAAAAAAKVLRHNFGSWED